MNNINFIDKTERIMKHNLYEMNNDKNSFTNIMSLKYFHNF